MFALVEFRGLVFRINTSTGDTWRLADAGWVQVTEPPTTITVQKSINIQPPTADVGGLEKRGL